MTLLGNVGFDPVYGARPLKRAIQQQLENPLAPKILAGEFGSGDTVQVDADGGHLVFARADPAFSRRAAAFVAVISYTMPPIA